LRAVLAFPLAGVLCVPAVLSAQVVGTELPARTEAPGPSPWRFLRVAKWAALTGAAGAAAYGFIHNGRADDRFRELERQCESDPVVCRDRLPDGSYRDPDFEAVYQDVLELDRRSRVALIAGQVGIATSVVLFLLDLGNERRPPDIPFNPGRLQLHPDPNGRVHLTLRFAVEGF
jgi:hypothetical protein